MLQIKAVHVEFHFQNDARPFGYTDDTVRNTLAKTRDDLIHHLDVKQ